jgi:predicted nucleotidyltransferase
MLQDAKFLNENEKKALMEIEARVQIRFAIWQFILFGSKARGDFGPDSDIDLLIVTEKNLDWREKDSMITDVYEVNLMFGTLFTIHTAVKEEWEHGLWTVLSLKENIDKDGILV